MSDRTEQQLRNFFQQPSGLPSNFDYLVMQRIAGLRLARARKSAQLQSSLITLAMAISLTAILAVLGRFFELPDFQIPSGSMVLVPAVMVIILAVLLDAGLGLRKKN